MLRDITIGQHFPGNSLVHRFDPQTEACADGHLYRAAVCSLQPLGAYFVHPLLGVMYKVAKFRSR